MAAFFRYSCSWHSCGKQYGSLLELIDHIEVVHIDKDPRVLEKQEAKQPTALPLSYINRFFTEAARTSKQKEQSVDAMTAPEQQVKKKRFTPPKLAIPSLDHSDSLEGGEDDANFSDSDDSWASDSINASDLILNAVATDDGDGKRYVCPVPGCGKRYKNVNGIKYHAKNGHRKDIKLKAHKCHCGKSYKSPSGLRHHMMSHHQVTPKHTLPTIQREVEV